MVNTLLTRHAAAFLAALALALAFAATGAADPPEIARKQVEQQQVLAQVNAIDMELGKAAEAYNGATYRLGRIRADLTENKARLVTAQKNFKRAQQRIAERLVELYESGGESSITQVLVGASSLSDLLNRIDAVGRISAQDARIVREVEAYRTEIERREKQLEQAEASQKREVARRASERSAIEAKLAERKRLLSSIQGEIDRLRAAERERQARLAEQARQKLAESQKQTTAQSNTQTNQSTTTAESQPSSSGSSSSGSTSSPSSSSSSSSSSGGAPPPSSRGLQAVQIAMKYLGVPYVWGGASPSGFDCSGLTMYVYAQLGVSLPHYAAAQYQMGTPVSRGNLAPGDLVFFAGLGHMGMYIGGGRFIHAPHTGDVVKISSLYESWYASEYVGARRL